MIKKYVKIFYIPAILSALIAVLAIYTWNIGLFVLAMFFGSLSAYELILKYLIRYLKKSSIYNDHLEEEALSPELQDRIEREVRKNLRQPTSEP